MEQKPFADLFVDVTKRAVKIQKIDYLPMGRYPIIDQGQEWCAGFTNEEKGLYRDVPAYIFGDHTRVIKYVDKPFYLGADGVKLLKLREGIQASPRFFYYALKSQRIPDTGYNRHFKWLKESLYHVPTLDEQTHIADVLDTLSTLITLCEKKIFLFNELVKSQFVEMFGDPVANPMGWEVKKLSDIAEYYNGLTYRPEYTSDDGTLVLRSSNIQEGRLAFKDNVFVSCDIREKYFVQKNDILMCSRNGSARLVGKVAIIKDIDEPMAFGSFMMIIRSKLWAYLYVYFQMVAFRRQIITGKTSTINQITGKMLDAVELPVPTEDAVEKFMLFTQLVDKSKLVLRQLLEKQKTLKAALMQEYFS